MGGLLAFHHQAIPLKAHPKREVVVFGNFVVLQYEGLCISPVAPLTCRKIIFARVHSIYSIQTDGTGQHLAASGKRERHDCLIRIVELQVHVLNPQRIGLKGESLTRDLSCHFRQRCNRFGFRRLYDGVEGCIELRLNWREAFCPCPQWSRSAKVRFRQSRSLHPLSQLSGSSRHHNDSLSPSPDSAVRHGFVS